MRHANGYGSIYKLSGKRRRPYRVVLTKSYVMEGNHAVQKRQTLGYFATQKEAIAALDEYHKDPYDLKDQNLTFAEVYDRFIEEKKKTIVPSVLRGYKASYSRFKPLYDYSFADLRLTHLEGTIDNADGSPNMKARMKSLLNLMYQYALRHEICQKDYSALMKSYKVPASHMHKAFRKSEIKILWNKMGEIPNLDMVIIGIYTGLRPQELCTLTLEQYHTTYFKAGMKTDAGKDRIIPIHPDIVSLVRKRVDESQTAPGHALFVGSGQPMTYDQYRHRFDNIMHDLKMDHRPHDTRHTFITLWKEQKLDDYIKELIVGHAMKSISDKVYTHLNLDDLYTEMCKLKIK